MNFGRAEILLAQYRDWIDTRGCDSVSVQKQMRLDRKTGEGMQEVLCARMLLKYQACVVVSIRKPD